MFSNTTSVESDFSILKWEMDEFRTSLMHLSLEGVFQSKQMALLRSVHMYYKFCIALRSKLVLDELSL
jgi:hypothetical protein